MIARPPFSALDLAAVFAEPRLRALRILHLAMPAGVLAFVAVSLAIAFDPPQGSAAPGMPILLSAVTAALTAGAWVAAFRVHSVLLARGVATARKPDELLPAVQKARIVRLALLEAPALFGGLALLLAALDGSLRSQPLLVLNALPAAGFAAFSWATRPRSEALVEEIAAVERDRTFAIH